MCLQTDSRSLCSVDCGPGDPVCAQLLHGHGRFQGCPGLCCKVGTCDLHPVVVKFRNAWWHKYGRMGDLRADHKNRVLSQRFVCLLRSNSAISKTTADVNSPHCSVCTPPFVPSSSKQIAQGLFGSAILVPQVARCNNQPRLRLSQDCDKLCDFSSLNSQGSYGKTLCSTLLYLMVSVIGSGLRIVCAASFPASCLESGTCNARCETLAA